VERWRPDDGGVRPELLPLGSRSTVLFIDVSDYSSTVRVLLGKLTAGWSSVRGIVCRAELVMVAFFLCHRSGAPRQ